MKKVTTYGSNGNVISVEDFRTLSEAKRQRVEYLAQRCTQAIEDAGIDEYDQRNAALGLLGEPASPGFLSRIFGGVQEDSRIEFILRTIGEARDHYHEKKALVMAAASNEEADAVEW